MTSQAFAPKLISFDVFGTMIDVRAGSYAAFETILAAANAPPIDVREFWEHWETRNIAHYVEPYRRYRDICTLSLQETFTHYGLHADPALIHHYFDAFPTFPLFPDVAPTLDHLRSCYRLAVVSNIDDDLLAATRLPQWFDLVCTAERAQGYKPDGTLFRYLLGQTKSRFDLERDDILHAGQSQHTDMVGAKPLGLAVAWINRRAVPLHPSVPPPDATLPDIASLLPLLQA